MKKRGTHARTVDALTEGGECVMDGLEGMRQRGLNE